MLARDTEETLYVDVHQVISTLQPGRSLMFRIILGFLFTVFVVMYLVYCAVAIHPVLPPSWGSDSDLAGYSRYLDSTLVSSTPQQKSLVAPPVVFFNRGPLVSDACHQRLNTLLQTCSSCLWNDYNCGGNKRSFIPGSFPIDFGSSKYAGEGIQTASNVSESLRLICEFKDELTSVGILSLWVTPNDSVSLEVLTENVMSESREHVQLRTVMRGTGPDPFLLSCIVLLSVYIVSELAAFAVLRDVRILRWATAAVFAAALSLRLHSSGLALVDLSPNDETKYISSIKDLLQRGNMLSLTERLEESGFLLVLLSIFNVDLLNFLALSAVIFFSYALIGSVAIGDTGIRETSILDFAFLQFQMLSSQWPDYAYWDPARHSRPVTYSIWSFLNGVIMMCVVLNFFQASLAQQYSPDSLLVVRLGRLVASGYIPRRRIVGRLLRLEKLYGNIVPLKEVESWVGRAMCEKLNKNKYLTPIKRSDEPQSTIPSCVVQESANPTSSRLRYLVTRLERFGPKRELEAEDMALMRAIDDSFREVFAHA